MSLDLLTSSTSSVSSANAPPQRRSLTWLLPTGLVLGFLLIFALLFGQRLLPATEVNTAPVISLRLSAEAIKPPTVESESAPNKGKERKMGKGEMLFQASGWIEPDPYTTYVPVLINGVVNQVHVLEGQSVKQGDLLATLIDDEAKLNLQEAEVKIKSLSAKITAHCVGVDIALADINAANKKVEALKALQADSADNLIRLEKLPTEAIPEQQVVQARLAKIRREALVAEAEAIALRLRTRITQIGHERESMESQLAELHVKRDQSQLALDRTKITSPMDGIVLKLHAAPGKKRMLNMDDPDSAVIVALYNPDQLQARIDVPLTEASGIQVGQTVELTSDILPDTVFQGEVTRINGEADIQRNTLQVKVKILQPDHRFRPEMLVRGKFYAGSSTQKRNEGPSYHSARLALFIPEESIIDSNSVWVVSTSSKAELRSVKLGEESRDGHRRVLSGVLSGEQVILPPHDGMEEGDSVIQ